MFAINPDHQIRDEQALRDLFPPVHTLAALKSQDHLDQHARDFIRRAPFVCLGTQGLEGKADVSPRGDPVGFVRILDDHTLAIPDRPGNNRLDSLTNIVANPNVGLLFIVPGFDDTVRVNGKAYLVTTPDLLDSMAVNGKSPRVAIIVRVEEVFMHCAKAFRRSRLWDPSHHQDRAEFPSLMKVLLDVTGNTPPSDEDLQKRDAALEEDYKNSMY